MTDPIFNPSYLANVNATGVDLSQLDVETALMMVQTQRANLLEAQLKDQMLAVQKRNTSIQTLNAILAAVRDARPTGESTAEGETGYAQIQVPIEDMRGAQQEYVAWIESQIDLYQGLIDDGNDPAGINANLLASYQTQLVTAKERLDEMSGPDAPTLWTTTLTTALDIYGFKSGEMDQSEFDQLINNVSSRIDGLNSTQQLDMLRLQSITNKRNEAFDIMTNFVKKMQDSRSSIVGNMR